MKHLFIILFFLNLTACTSQGYLLYNSSDKDVIINGSYLGAIPLVWGGKGPLGFFKKSRNCQIIFNGDSVISMEHYLNYINQDTILWKMFHFKDVNIANVSIKVSPKGYIPIASRIYLIFQSKKYKTECFPFLRPMEIIQNNDTVMFNDSLLLCPPVFKPIEYGKEIDGMPIFLECK